MYDSWYRIIDVIKNVHSSIQSLLCNEIELCLSISIRRINWTQYENSSMRSWSYIALDAIRFLGVHDRYHIVPIVIDQWPLQMFVLCKTESESYKRDERPHINLSIPWTLQFHRGFDHYKFNCFYKVSKSMGTNAITAYCVDNTDQASSLIWSL